MNHRLSDHIFKAKYFILNYQILKHTLSLQLPCIVKCNTATLISGNTKKQEALIFRRQKSLIEVRHSILLLL